MNSRINHEEFDALVDAYALDALAPDERDRFKAHLATCKDCQAAVAESMRVLAALGETVEPVAPPPALKARVIAHAIGSAPRMTTMTSERIERIEPRRTPTMNWLALAAAILLVIAGGYAWSLREQLATTRESVTEATTRAAQLRTELLAMRAESARLSHTLDVMNAPDVIRVDLAGQPKAASASGRAFWSPTKGLVFNATGLPALPSNLVYQLWVVTSASPLKAVSAGLLTLDASGVTSSVTSVPGSPKAAGIGVSIEPAGGSASPSPDIVLVGLATPRG